MPRLNERTAEDRIPTFLQLPAATRAELEAAIDRKTIFSLTDAVVAAAKLLDRKPKPRRKETRP